MPDIPLLVIIAAVWLYWGRVGSMVLRARRRSHDLAGLVPEQSRERAMWLGWVPVVALWLALPIVAATHPSGWFAVPAFARSEPLYAALRWIAAAGALVAFVLTVRCHVQMGRNWRMAVSEKQKTSLVTEGLYARVRHPIYALQVMLMVCTAIVLPAVPMLVVAAVHAVLVVLKAANEERFLLATHGASYADYRKRTGRFLPRLRAH
jgi:protein-S-isoprenylcysteine O-methyltransferase Ste14